MDIDTLAVMISNSFTDVQNSFKELRDDLGGRIERVEKRLDERIDRVEKGLGDRIDQLDNRIDNVEHSLYSLHKKFDNFETVVDGHEVRIEILEDRI